MTKDDFALVCLITAGSMPPSRLSRVIAAAGKPSQVLESSPTLLAKDSGVDRDDLVRLVRQAESEQVRIMAARDRKLCADRGVQLVGLHDPMYPTLLNATPDPPLALWVWGKLTAEDVYAAAIIGSSQCSAYGAKQAKRFGRACGEHGLTLINSGEQGIDTHAIEAALDAGGRVVIVLGAGVFAHNRGSYHENLYQRVVESGRGVVLSSMPATTPPNITNQVLGDYIVTGLALGILVAEAATQSGALIAARVARQQTNREVFALPGRVDDPMAAGTLRLISEGNARLVLGTEGFLDQLIEAAQELSYRMIRSQPALRLLNRDTTDRNPLHARLDENAREVFKLLRDTPQTAEELARVTGQPAEKLHVLLYRLALSGGLIKSGSRYRWVTEA